MHKFLYPLFFIAIFFVWIFILWQVVFYKNSTSASQHALTTTKTASMQQSAIAAAPKNVLGISRSVQPTQQPATPTQESKSDFLIKAVNQYRKTKGLALVVPNDSTCFFAQMRAKEITTDFSHAGFQKRLTSHTLPYPNYALVTENIAETNDYTRVVDLWENSPGHAKNMQADTPYVCIENSGNFYAYEGWRPL